MKIGVNLKIDVTKIDKTKLFVGQKGKYLDATVFVDVDQQDQYGNNGMITQQLPKEEREAGGKGEILGNCKVFWKAESASHSSPHPNQTGGVPGGAPSQSAPAEGFDDIF